MFADLMQLTVDENGYLVDDRGIKHRRKTPLRTIQLKLYGKPYVFETPLGTTVVSKLLQDMAAASPKPNAWLDAGVLSMDFETLELPDMDLDGSIHREAREVECKLRRLEFYHLGE